MPNPLLVVNPATEAQPPKPHPVGTLLVKQWGGAKTVRNKVCKVVRVRATKYGHGLYAYTYHKYDVQWLGGKIERGVSADYYISFEKWRKRLENNIEAYNKIINKQYKILADSVELEKKAKEAFGVGE